MLSGRGWKRGGCLCRGEERREGTGLWWGWQRLCVYKGVFSLASVDGVEVNGVVVQRAEDEEEGDGGEV